MLVVKDYKVKWSHDNRQPSNQTMKGKGKWNFGEPHVPQASVTTCNIYRGEGLVSTGISRCSPEDNFSRKEGRYRSLRKALLSDIPKEERGMFWEAYFQKWPNK